jgi:hypothetical protein
MQKLPVGRIVRLAYAFTFGEIGTIIGLVWIPALVTAVAGFFAMGGYYGAMADATQSGVPMAGGPQFAFFFLYLIGAMLLAAVMAVAVAKQALGLREGPAVAHFALGGQEARVFGGFIGLYLLIVMFAAAVLLLSVGGGVGVSMLAKSNPAVTAVSAIILGVLVIVGLLAVLYVAVRLSFLFIPAAVVDGEFGITRSWELTKGNFWRIVAIGLAVFGPVLLVVGGVELVILGPAYFALLQKMIQDQAHTAVYQAEQMRLMLARLPFLVGLQLVITPIIQGLMISPAAFAYRVLTGKPRPLPES